MKSEDTLAGVTRVFHLQGCSRKRISRELHISRTTIRKIRRSDETSFSYERERLPKLNPWQDQLDGSLNGNRGKAAREQLILIRIYKELCSLGYEGGYDAVRRYAESWAKAQGRCRLGRSRYHFELCPMVGELAVDFGDLATMAVTRFLLILGFEDLRTFALS